MSLMKYAGVTILFLGLWTFPLPAQTDAGKPSPSSTVVVGSGSYQLTEQMLDWALQFGQILAAADFSPANAAALRTDLIAYFQKEPGKQIEAYEPVAKYCNKVSAPSSSLPGWTLR